ncbi:mannosyltransferase putative-domain-containing protein [Obelidium mucronatum]|nr:mannosyltransferase putative-domain-containing protein [Obelidium mucronatum]
MKNQNFWKQLLGNDPGWRTLLHTLIEDHTHTLYPWIFPKFKSIRDMQTKFMQSNKPDGIVFTTGQWHFELCLHAILCLRDILNCTLPIEVFYAGPGDLNPNMIQKLRSIKNVTVEDIWDHFGDEASRIAGWAIKPFAILASQFRNVVFIDADALFFQDPIVLLRNSRIFAEFGQIFYHDRTIGSDNAEFFKSFNPYPTNYAKTLRYLTHRSSHEMESGVVVVDKGRTGVLHALLLVCQMNAFDERSYLYQEIHGDKESFWFAWDVLRVPYSFSKHYGGAVGYKNEQNAICGGLFHTDEQSQPLWWNGGVLKNKHGSKDSEFMTFEFAAVDTTGWLPVWLWETDKTPFCLYPKNPSEVLELDIKQKLIGDKYVDLYQNIVKMNDILGS